LAETANFGSTVDFYCRQVVATVQATADKTAIF
jgi:hypothetical protein